MRGSMLTEDIDSSMRTVERGLQDPVRPRHRVARARNDHVPAGLEPAPALGPGLVPGHDDAHARACGGRRASTFRQKFGATYLLGWREVYPWLSLQVFPLVAYWISRGDTLSSGWPIFFCTTLFVLHIGPMQTLFAYQLADRRSNSTRAGSGVTCSSRRSSTPSTRTRSHACRTSRSSSGSGPGRSHPARMRRSSSRTSSSRMSSSVDVAGEAMPSPAAPSDLPSCRARAWRLERTTRPSRRHRPANHARSLGRRNDAIGVSRPLGAGIRAPRQVARRPRSHRRPPGSADAAVPGARRTAGSTG